MRQGNRVVKNAAWIIVCKIIQSVLALVINMLTARYLGPSNYGVINYVASLVAFAEPIVFLGLSSILVQELLQKPEAEGEILGTSLVLSLVSSLCCMVGCFAFVRWLNAGEQETILVCVLYSFILIFKALELTQYWFQAKLLSKYTSVVMLCAYLTVSIYRVVLLVSRRSIYWFSVVNALDCLLIAAALLVLYKKLGGKRLRFSRSRAKALLARSRYFIVSSMMITVFAQTDKIMLKLMCGEESTGLYASAVACALLSNFVFSAVFDSARPSILASKKTDAAAYEKKMVYLYALVLYLSLGQCVALGVLARPVIRILYGEAYMGAVPILQVVVWYTLFSYVGMVRSIWILAEDLQRYLWIINLSGALMNVVLNVFLIPVWGAAGAACASIATQFFSNVVLSWVIPPLRKSNRLMFRGLHFQCLLQMVREQRKD